MAGKIFISYRRDDSAAYAGRIYDRLEREFGRDRLFMDVDAIPLGVDFTKALREEVAKCDVLLAVIGDDWVNAQDEKGKRRLDNPNDFVRVEIATALKRNIPVIPLLMNGARIPTPDELPKDLQELARRNGLDVHHASFHRDMSKLLRELKDLLGDAGRYPPAVRSTNDVLSLEFGEGGQFESIPKHSLYGITRQFSVCVVNQSAIRAVSDCKVQIIEIEPHSGIKLPRVLKEGFSLAAGDRTFIPLARYGEAREPDKYNCADTLIEILGGDRPITITSEQASIIKMRVTAMGAPFQEKSCKVWVDPQGRFRINDANAPDPISLTVERDVWLYDAICRLFLGQWKKIPMKDGQLDLSANGFQAVHDLLEYVRQLAFDGKFPIWGKQQGYTALWEKAEPSFWQNNQISYFSFTDGGPQKLCAVPRDTGGQVISLRELMTSRAVVDAISTKDLLCTNDANSLRILTGTGKPFDTIEVNEYGEHHTICVQVTNVGSKFISNCKFYRTYIRFTDDKQKTLLDGPFSLEPGERRNISIAMFNETKKLPNADHLIGLSMPPSALGAGITQPRLPVDRRHVVSFVAESPDSTDAVLHCQLWVDESGKLRLEPL